MSDFSIQKIIAWTKLIWHWKVRDQINTIEKLETKLIYDMISFQKKKKKNLKYDIKDRDQICSLSY